MPNLQILRFPSLGEGNRPDQILVRELSRIYQSELERRHDRGLLAADFLRRCRRTWRDFARKLGHVSVERLKSSDLENWIYSHSGWASSHTRKNAASEILGGLRWADDEGIVRNPIRRFRPSWAPPQPREAMSEEECNRMIRLLKRSRGLRLGGERRCPGRAEFRLALTFLWQTGARTKEMREATWQDLDWRTGLVILNRHKTARKTGAERIIPLSDRMLRLLSWVKTRRNPKASDPIFLTSRGGAWSQRAFADQFRFFADRVGVRPNVSPASVRHGFTVAGLEAGIGERQLADVLGHTTTRYIGWYGRKAKSNAEYLRGIATKVSETRK